MSSYKPLALLLFILLAAAASYSQAEKYPCVQPSALVFEPEEPSRYQTVSVSGVADDNAYSSYLERFRIQLPVNFQALRSIPCTVDGRRGNGQKFTWFGDTGDFHIAHLSYPQAVAVTDRDRAVMIAEVKKDILTKAGAKIVSEKAVAAGTIKGTEITFDAPNGGGGITRVFFADDEQFIVSAVFKADAPEDKKLAEAVLDSFQIFPAAEKKKYIADSLARRTPKPLPQTPAVPRAQSDAQEEHLKGKVKSVSTEIQQLTGEWAYQVRVLQTEDFYDAAGNLLKSIWYRRANEPRSVSMYGYIDGARVRIEAEMDDDSGSNIGLSMAVPEPPPPPHAPDPRYTEKYVFAYDKQARLIKKTTYNNDGTVSVEKTYKYGNGVVESHSTNGDDSFNNTSTIKYDRAQNMTEKRDSESKEIYTYEAFDKFGNWTIRKAVYYYLEDKKWVEDSSEREYRAITYYP